MDVPSAVNVLLTAAVAPLLSVITHLIVCFPFVPGFHVYVSVVFEAFTVLPSTENSYL